jgi:hypothetical protein
MKKKSRYIKVATTLLSMNLLFACSNDSTSVTNSDTQTGTEGASTISKQEMTSLISEKVTYDNDDYFSNWENENPTSIELNGTDANFNSAAAVILSDKVLTIKTGGVYVLSGKFDGQIVVDAEDKSTVRLVLNGVEINNSDSSAIHVAKAKKTTISLVEGTENRLTDGNHYVFADSSTDEPNAAIFSKDDLTINGTGKLIVTGNYNNGITSKDELKITSGNIQIDAVDDGLMGRDLVAVKEGNITINAGGDGIKSSNDKDTSKGTIALEGGTYNVVAGNDGIQAVTSLLIADGSYTIASGGGSPETISTNDERMGGQSGANTTMTNTENTESDSFKGLKATVEIAVSSGTFKIDSLDDAIHSNDSLTIAGGDFTIASGDDGIHTDTSIVTTGGNIDITKSYEGIESKLITVEDGDIHLTASDDGINIGGGNDGSGMDMQSDSEDSKLQINGGYIYVNASGDGLDSNGSIAMTAGTVIVNGPTASMNGPLDYNGSFEMSGGSLVAVGSSGMAQSSSEESAQSGILMSYSETQAAGTMVHLEDSEGNTVISFVPVKEYQSVFISSPKLTKDASYTLYSGGTSTGNEVDGLYTDGDYQGGTKIVEITMSDNVTWLNESGVTTARSSGPGGSGQNRPEMSNQGAMFADLDEETREKVQAIMEQQRAGTITQEEAQAQLAELGVEFPVRDDRP